MKKFLMILGILLIIAGVLALLLAALFYFAAYHTLDGSAGLYYTQMRYMMIFLGSGAVLVIAGVLCLIRRKRI